MQIKLHHHFVIFYSHLPSIKINRSRSLLNSFSPLVSPPQFERDKQHDIRMFFSPSGDQEKKRKRTEEQSSDSPPPARLPEGTEPNRTPEIQNSVSKEGEDFSPQVKRFRQVSPLSRHKGKKSPLSPLFAPRRLSAGLQAPRHNQKWSCVTCTFANSGLLLRCEMCETPRNLQRGDVTFAHISYLYIKFSFLAFCVNTNLLYLYREYNS